MPGIVETDCARLLKSLEPFGLVILSPAIRRQNAVAACCLGSGHNSFLYTLGPDDTDLHALLHALDRTLHEGQPTGDRELRSALGRRRLSLQTLAEALVTDLLQINPDVRQLVLDCFDYLAADEDIQRFFEHLVTCLPDGLKVVVNTRQLSHRFWSPFVRAGQAVILTDDAIADFFTPDQLDKPHLEVYALSVGQVYRDGVRIDEWDGPLPRNLFFYLVDHPAVTRDEIFATFWPDLSVKEATNVFHVTKRKITERLGCELTQYAGGFYHHNKVIRLHYDVAAFERAVTEAEQATPQQAPALWARAIAYYRVPFLHTVEMPWISARRDQVRGTYANALIQLGRWHRQQGELDLAVSFFLRAQREFPEREDLCRDLMALYHRRGDTTRATELYRRLADRLRTKFGIKPSKTTELLYQEIAPNS